MKGNSLYPDLVIIRKWSDENMSDPVMVAVSWVRPSSGWHNSKNALFPFK